MPLIIILLFVVLVFVYCFYNAKHKTEVRLKKFEALRPKLTKEIIDELTGTTRKNIPLKDIVGFRLCEDKISENCERYAFHRVKIVKSHNCSWNYINCATKEDAMRFKTALEKIVETELLKGEKSEIEITLNTFPEARIAELVDKLENFDYF